MALVLLDLNLNIIEFAEALMVGDPMRWATFGVVLRCVAFFAAYQKLTGEAYVMDARTRRRAKARRYRVVREHERDG